MDISNQKIKEAVEKLVQDILAGEASASASSKLEEILSESSVTIKELKNAIVDLEKAAVDNTAAVEDLEKVKTELETEVTALKEQVKELDKEKTEFEERATKAEDVLANMEKDQAADSRMAELVEVKVVRVDKEAASAQRLYVRDMSDEEFASYKDERVALRKELLDVIAQETAAGKAKSKVGEGSDGKGSEAGSKEESEGGEVIPPADIESALENASATLPNTASAGEGKDWKKFEKDLSNLCAEKRGEDPKTQR